MASYSYKIKENADLCQYIHSSEKDYGVQCVIMREANNIKEYSPHHYAGIKTLFESRPQDSVKEVAFLHVAPPAKAFEKFDQEKYKLVLTAKAYLKVLEFFQSEWSLLFKRMESDIQNIKAKKEWITLNPNISFRGAADIIFMTPLDTTNTYALNLVVTKRIETGKTNITLSYTDETLGSLHLPPAAMDYLAQDTAYLTKLLDYKEPVATKRSRQC
jgi:hypothetical protein